MVAGGGSAVTRADLDALPDDGLRHELIDGAFVMTPEPGVAHQRFAFALARALHEAAKSTDLEVLMAPLDVVLGPHVVQPDIVVAPQAAFTQRDLPTAPLLALEIRSASTGWLDEGRKRTLYEAFGVASYWLVDPLASAITILERTDGHYTQIAYAHGAQPISLTERFAVTLNPMGLAQS